MRSAWSAFTSTWPLTDGQQSAPGSKAPGELFRSVRLARCLDGIAREDFGNRPLDLRVRIVQHLPGQAPDRRPAPHHLIVLTIDEIDPFAVLK